MRRNVIVDLLSIENLSQDYYNLLYESYNQSKSLYGNKGYLFAQLGLNNEPCSVNCSFCSLASDNFCNTKSYRRNLENVLQTSRIISETKKVSDLFLMSTADYPKDLFLEFISEVRKVIDSKMRLIANIGDFDTVYASEMKSAGLNGAYHVVRLGEERYTNALKKDRVSTLNAIKQSDLDLYYCVEPIAPEHSYSEIAEEIERAMDYDVDVMAVMKRTAVPGTKFYGKGEISIYELCKIAAVTALSVKPKLSMNVHETEDLAFMVGVNQIYAELGANPRDIARETQESRGLTIKQGVALLEKYGLKPTLKQ